MFLSKRLLLLVVLGVAGGSFSLLTGCSSRSGQAETNNPAYSQLQQLDEMIRRYAASFGRTPGRLEDLSGYQSISPRAFEAVQSGNIVVLWGRPLKGEEDVGKDETILAYEKDAPVQGGFVLLATGAIKQMSVSQIESASRGQ